MIHIARFLADLRAFVRPPSLPSERTSRGGGRRPRTATATPTHPALRASVPVPEGTYHKYGHSWIFTHHNGQTRDVYDQRIIDWCESESVLRRAFTITDPAIPPKKHTP